MARLLGIDLGTTTCRAAIFDEDGREVVAAYRESTVDFPRPLWAEVDPDVWWRTTCEVVREVAAKVGGEVDGIGLSGLMHAPVLLDGEGRPVTPAQLWMDQRSADQAAAMNAEGGPRGLPREVATTVSAPKLRWLAEKQPDVLARARMLMLPKDYIRYRLSGVAGTDTSDAGGTGLWDRERDEWHATLVELSKVPTSLLPEAGAAHARAGHVTAAAAAETGLREGTPVALGGADTLCTRLGVGDTEDGEALVYMGTAAWISVMGPRGTDGLPRVRAWGGSTATTGASLRWARDLLAPAIGGTIAASYEAVLREAAEVTPGSEGLFFLPHLMGERGPEPDPLARGALIGLTLKHRRPQIVRAVIEGTAYQIQRNLEVRGGGGLRGIVGAGGVAKSPLWMQILADVTGLQVRVPEVAETSVLGAAMLGAAAAGVMTVEESQRRMVRAGQVYRPGADHERYAELYRHYCRLDAMLAPWFREEH